MQEGRIKIVPEVSSYLDDRRSKLIIIITIPGVKRDEINCIITEKTFKISAVKREILYEVSLPLCCPVKPYEATAVYTEGRLIVEAPLKSNRNNEVNVIVE